MELQLTRIEDLTEDPENARLHPEANLEAIKVSLTRFGQQKPIVVDAAGKVIAGNGTLAAARALGWEGIYTVVSDLSAEQLQEYGIMDNRTGDLAEWDLDRLLATLDVVRDREGAGLDAVGFTAEDMLFLRQEARRIEEAAFQPELAPTVAEGNVTAEDVAKARAEEAARFTGKGEEYVSLSCPSCGHEFSLDKAALREELAPSAPPPPESAE